MRKLLKKNATKRAKLIAYEVQILRKKIWSFCGNLTLDCGTITCHNELSFLLIYQKKQKERINEDRKACGLTIHVCMAE